MIRIAVTPSGRQRDMDRRGPMQKNHRYALCNLIASWLKPSALSRISVIFLEQPGFGLGVRAPPISASIIGSGVILQY